MIVYCLSLCSLIDLLNLADNLSDVLYVCIVVEVYKNLRQYSKKRNHKCEKIYIILNKHILTQIKATFYSSTLRSTFIQFKFKQTFPLTKLILTHLETICLYTNQIYLIC